MAKEAPISTNARIAENKPKVSKPAGDVNRWFVSAFNVSLRWIDINLLPIICLALLAGFAAIGFSTFLTHLTYTYKIGLSIAFVALLAVKTHNR